MNHSVFHQTIDRSAFGLEVTIAPVDGVRVVSEARMFLENLAYPRDIAAYRFFGRDDYGFEGWSMTFDDDPNPRANAATFPEYEVIAARLYLYDEPEDIFIDFLVRDN